MKTPRHVPRPRWLTGLLLLCAFVQAAYAVQIVLLPAELAEQVSLLLPLEFVMAGMWALLLGYFAVNGGTFGARWVLLLVFMAYHVIRLIIFARADYDRGRIPFIVVMFCVWLVMGGVMHWRKAGDTVTRDLDKQGE